MTVLKTNACRSCYGRMTYLFNSPAHCDTKTNHRVLACNGFNVKMFHDASGHVSNTQNGAFLQKQFQRVLNRAWNPNKTYQVQSLIVSFSKSEFNTKNLKKQSAQALKTMQGFVYKYFSDCQVVMAVQADGVGGRQNGDGKLHCHVLINTVKPDGKVVNTNRFRVSRLRNELDKYMQAHFAELTGQQWDNPANHQQTNRPTKVLWQQQLKTLIQQAKVASHNFAQFQNYMSQHGVAVQRHGKKKPHLTYVVTVSGKKGPKKRRVRDFYQRVNKKTGAVISTRGLGVDYTLRTLEKYWEQQQQNSSPAKVVRHHSKEEEKHEKYSNEEIQQLFADAAKANAQSAHQRQIQRQAFQRLLEFERADQQRRARQKARRQAESAAAGKEVGQQEGHSARRRSGEQRQSRNSASHQPKDDGPEP